MYIYANSSIRVEESLSTSLRSTIKTIGNVSYTQSLAWDDRRDLKNLFESKVNWKDSIASLSFSKLESEKIQKHNEWGWLILDGQLQIHVETGNLSIRCGCALSEAKWHLLRADLIGLGRNNQYAEFVVNQINCSQLIKSEETIEAKIELYIESYTLINNTFKSENC